MEESLSKRTLEVEKKDDEGSGFLNNRPKY